MANSSGGDFFDEAQDMVNEAVTSPEVRGFDVSLTGCLIFVVTILVLASIGIAIFNALLGGGSGSTSEGIAVESDSVSSDGQEGAIQISPGDGVDWIPRDGTWEIENLPFLPECGPGSLGSGFQQGTIEVIDEGGFIVASGSQPGTASIELGLVDAGAGFLVYFGVEPISGMEMEMTFTSPTELSATVRNGEAICVERPAIGAWDREIGEPDPDAEEDEALPEWMPAGFPISGSGRVDTIEAPTSKTVTVVVPDTQPTDVLFSIAEWAVEKGHTILERGATTLTIEIGLNELMYVEVLDIGNFNTQLTVTIEET